MAQMRAAGQGKADLQSAQRLCGIDTRELELGGISALEGLQELPGFVFTQGPRPLEVRRRQEPTALITAAENGQAELVRWLLEHGADPRTREPDGMRALDCAAEHGHQAVVELLLVCAAPLLELPGLGDRTALLAAVAGQHVPLVRRLLLLGADPTRFAADGTRALDQAARDGHAELVELLLAHDPGLLDLPGYGERCALAAAACGGHTALVQTLIKRGADPAQAAADGTRALDAAASHGHQAVAECLLAHDPALLYLPGHGGHSALLAAAAAGHAALVEWLLGRGADARSRACDGAHALELACQAGHRDVAERLSAHDPRLLELAGRGEGGVLSTAAAHGHLPLVQRLLSLGANPRQRAASGAHALEAAAAAGHEEVVDALLAHDAQLLGLPGRGERQGLAAAAAAGHAAVVRTLLQRGADAFARASNGAHALDEAAAAGELAVVELLVAHDQELLDFPGKRERTALHAAAAGGQAAVVECLLARGADPGLRSADDEHALSAACAAGHEAVVERLVAQAPQLLELPGRDGRTALVQAAMAGHADLVRVLLACGADPRQRGADGANALFFAARDGHDAVVTELLEFDPTLLDVPVIASAERLIDAPRWLPLPRSGLHQACGLNVIEVLILARRSAAALGLLRRHRSRIHAAGASGLTPLTLSAATEQCELTSWLLTAGADPGMKDAAQSHALLYALEQHALGCAQCLIEHDPQLALLPGPGGRTPAMVVAQMWATAECAAMRAGPAQLLAVLAGALRAEQFA